MSPSVTGSFGAAVKAPALQQSKRQQVVSPRVPSITHWRSTYRKDIAKRLGASSLDLDKVQLTDKEKSRKFRRTVFGHEDWLRHRSTGRYFRHIQGIFESRIIRGLGTPLRIVILISTIVVTYETLREAGLLPAYFKTVVVESPAPFTLTSFALSLLLVFRTNAAYGRWDEARKMWGLVTNRCRDLTRQGLTWLPADRPDLKDMWCRWVSTYPSALRDHLTYDGDLPGDLKDILTEKELKELLNCKHKPNYVAHTLSKIVFAGQLTDQQIFNIDTNLTLFSDTTGGNERIFKTPIPLSWTRHTSRFLIIWLGFMPFTLYKTCHFATIPVAAVISILLLAIDEVSVSIEEPYSILPLETMFKGIRDNIREHQALELGVEALVEKHNTPRSENASSNGTPAENSSQ